MNVKELVSEATSGVFKARRRRAKPHVSEKLPPVTELVEQVVEETNAPIEEAKDELAVMDAPAEPPKKVVAPVAAEPDKNDAEFLICVKNGLIACRRSRCGVKAYPVGGTLGSLTLEQLAERQGWKIAKKHILYTELVDGKRVVWFTGEAEIVRRAGTTPIWADRGHVERSDHIHDGALDAFFGD